MNLTKTYYEEDIGALKSLELMVKNKIREKEISILKRESSRELIKKMFASNPLGIFMALCARKNGTNCCAINGYETEDWEWNKDYIKELLPDEVGDFLNYLYENSGNFDIYLYDICELYLRPINDVFICLCSSNTEYLDDWCFQEEYFFDKDFYFVLDICLELLKNDREEIEKLIKEDLFSYIDYDNDFFQIAKKNNWGYKDDGGSKHYYKDLKVSKAEMFDLYLKEIFPNLILGGQ